MENIYRRRSIWIKVCGMTRREDIDLAIKLKVNALGFILAESPRTGQPGRCPFSNRGIAPFLSRVAVVVNPDAEELERIITSRLFDYIQIHGVLIRNYLGACRSGLSRPSPLQKRRETWKNWIDIRRQIIFSLIPEGGAEDGGYREKF